MIKNPQRPAEKLIASAEALPSISRGLRRRVLRATLEARLQQRRRRTVLFAASILVPILGLGAWYATIPADASSHAESWADSTHDPGYIYESRSPVREESVGEWNHVEDVVEHRKNNSRILRGALW